MPEDRQQTQPKGVDKDGKSYAPMEIPVPTETEVIDAFEKIAGVSAPESPADPNI